MRFCSELGRMCSISFDPQTSLHYLSDPIRQYIARRAVLPEACVSLGSWCTAIASNSWRCLVVAKSTCSLMDGRLAFSIWQYAMREDRSEER